MLFKKKYFFKFMHLIKTKKLRTSKSNYVLMDPFRSEIIQQQQLDFSNLQSNPSKSQALMEICMIFKI